jgi:hypothetical protein
MIEVQFISGSAYYAVTAVSIPDLELYRGRYDAPSLTVVLTKPGRGVFTVDCDQFEFEHCAPAILLAPPIYEVKESVVGLDPLLDLLVDAHKMWRGFFQLVVSCS